MSDTTAGASAAPNADERLAYRGVFQRALVRPEIGAAIGAVAVWVFFWAVSVKFGQASGAQSILDQAAAPLGIMAVAVALLMIGGEFDLSSGAATGALGILTILLVRDVAGEAAGAGFSLWVALPISLLAALGLGWWNGFLVNRTSLPSFIVTLGSFFVLKGAKLGFSKLIVDQIQVGKLDDLAIYAEENGVSDKGYGLLDKVFAGEWIRNEHVWDSRDWVYSIGTLAGLTLVVLAVYEFHFRRKDVMNPTGLIGVVVGIALGLAGVWQLHNTDGAGANTIGAALIGAGMLVGFIGWGVWRYAPHTRSDTTAGRPDGVTAPLIAGVICFVAAILVGTWMDAQNGEDLTEAFDLGGGTSLAIAIVVALVAMIWSAGTGGAAAGNVIGSAISAAAAAALGEARARVISTGIVAILATLGFLNLSTEQGARAIIFIALTGAAFVSLITAATRGRRHSDRAGSALLLLTSVALVVMAFFVQSESSAPKFRAEAFSFMLAFAAIMAVWAIANTRFEVRRFTDTSADTTARNMLLSAVLLIVVGMIARLGWVTTEEAEVGGSIVKYSVRILWFLGFTAVVSWVLARTRFGSWTFAVGGNKEAARQVGVPAARTKTQLFMVVSAAAWLVGVLLAFRLNTIQASTGDGEEFEYIIAAVVGGTALTGGYGSTIGAGIGALIMAMAVQGIPSARWNSDWRFVFVGGILLLAVVANNYIRTKAESAR